MYRIVFHEALCLAFAVEKFAEHQQRREGASLEELPFLGNLLPGMQTSQLSNRKNWLATS